MDGLIAYALAKKGSGGMPPAPETNGSTLVSVDEEWVQQEGYGFKKDGIVIDGGEPHSYGESGTIDVPGERFFKVSDDIIANFDLIGSTVNFVYSADQHDTTILSYEHFNKIEECVNCSHIEIPLDNGYTVTALFTKNSDEIYYGEYEIPSPGVYFSITVNGYDQENYITSIELKDTINQIDPSYTGTKTYIAYATYDTEEEEFESYDAIIHNMPYDEILSLHKQGIDIKVFLNIHYTGIYAEDYVDSCMILKLISADEGPIQFSNCDIYDEGNIAFYRTELYLEDNSDVSISVDNFHTQSFVLIAGEDYGERYDLRMTTDSTDTGLDGFITFIVEEE